MPCQPSWWNAESTLAVLETASKMKAPVILLCSTAKAAPLSLGDLGRVATALVARLDVSAALMLDHGTTFAHVEECLASGYTGILLDYCTRPFAENVEATRRVVAMAHALGVTVEVPDAEGVPEIKPVVVLTDKPAGSPVAP